MRKVCLLRGLFVLFTFQSPTWAQPAQFILDNYSASCPETASPGASNAEILIGKFRDVLNLLKNQSNTCFDASFLASFNYFQSSYDRYQSYRNNRLNKLETTEKIQSYLTQLEDPSLSPDTALSVQQALFDSQNELIQLNFKEKLYNKGSERWGDGVNQLAKGLETLTTVISNSPNCLGKQFSGLISTSLATASALSANPASSLGLGAGAVFAEVLRKYVANYKLEGSLRDMDLNQFPKAIRCVSEAFSKQYCESWDTKVLVEKYYNIDEIQNNRDEANPVGGLNLLEFKTQSLNNWLIGIYAGSPVSSEQAADQRKEILRQISFLEVLTNTLEGRIAEIWENFSSRGDSEVEESVVFAAIKEIIDLMIASSQTGGFSGSFPNPIFDGRYASLTIGYRIIGEVSNPMCDNGIGGQTPCTSFDIYFTNGVSRLNRFKASSFFSHGQQSLRIVNEVLNELRIVSQNIINFDPQRTLSNYNIRNNQYNSPEESIRGIKGYLVRIKKYFYDKGCEDSLVSCSSQEEENLLSEIPIYHPYIRQIQYAQKMEKKIDGIATVMFESLDMNRALDLDVFKKIGCGNILPKPPTDDMAEGESDDLCEEGDPEFKKCYKGKKKASFITQCVYLMADLDFKGTQNFFNGLQNVVTAEVEIRGEFNEFDDISDEIIRSSRLDLLDTLSRALNPREDEIVPKDDILDKLEDERGPLSRTVRVFTEYFGGKMGRSLVTVRLKPREKRNYCFRLLPMIFDVVRDPPPPSLGRIEEIMMGSSGYLKTIYDQCKDETMITRDTRKTFRWTDYLTMKNGKVLIKGQGSSFDSETIESREADFFCAIHRKQRYDRAKKARRRRPNSDYQ